MWKLDQPQMQTLEHIQSAFIIPLKWISLQIICMHVGLRFQAEAQIVTVTVLMIEGLQVDCILMRGAWEINSFPSYKPHTLQVTPITSDRARAEKESHFYDMSYVIFTFCLVCPTFNSFCSLVTKLICVWTT